MKKWNESLRKAGMVVFLVLIIIGFSVPLLFNPAESESNTLVEPRICQHDTDCYLTCGTSVVAVLCSQNLCVQNSCEDYSSLPFQAEPQRITLRVSLDGEVIPLAAQASPRNLFVTVEGDTLNLFSNRLPLGAILEKVGIGAKYPCLTFSGKSYCVQDNRKLLFYINGNQTYQYENYIPQTGDSIHVEYS